MSTEHVFIVSILILFVLSTMVRRARPTRQNAAAAAEGRGVPSLRDRLSSYSSEYPAPFAN
jgi:hypothetical protein